ncbi:MAG: DUF177 domain-containing protein [Bacteroidia bacterium]|nr:DUF177 domain-containing protein [Bacteroidia bacterium]MDO5443790.1 DUF177 domain-containing protein [Bacteroidia bacterium]
MAVGKSQFRWHAEGQFFSGFENSEILDADIDIDVIVEKSGKYIGVDLDLDGTVTVECDRCLADLQLPVSASPRFSVKFGEESENDKLTAEGEREIIFLPESDTDMDLSQVIYDYTCLSLPLSRVHEDGECDPETVKYLSTGTDAGPDRSEKNVESPFEALRSLLEEK